MNKKSLSKKTQLVNLIQFILTIISLVMELFDILSYIKIAFICMQVVIFGVIILAVKIDSLRKEFQDKKVLIVTAHPDDESMFFLPFIKSCSSSSNLDLLCLSIGDADGLGKIRVKELEKVSSFLGFSSYEIVDDDALEDGMNVEWDKKAILDHVEKYVRANNIDCVVTFDGYGVSGHTNHISISRAVKDLREVEVYQLESISILRKYIGILDSYFCAGNNIVALNVNPKLAWQAMSIHHSQFVWYRKLFVVFSRYAYINTLKRIKNKPASD